MFCVTKKNQIRKNLNKDTSFKPVLEIRTRKKLGFAYGFSLIFGFRFRLGFYIFLVYSRPKNTKNIKSIPNPNPEVRKIRNLNQNQIFSGTNLPS